jgi:hypothetical protein
LRYGLTAAELLDAINRRFRARVALEGVVAETHLEKQIRALVERGLVADYQHHDVDGYPDFSMRLPVRSDLLKIEVKNVRDAQEGYRQRGTVVAYKVEVQKTRAAQGDASSRYYDVGLFQILAVCLGKKTGNWTDFRFIAADRLSRHPNYPQKIAVMHSVPLPEAAAMNPWHMTLESLLATLQER